MEGVKAPSAVVEKPTGEYGVQDVMRNGLSTANDDLRPAHPLELPESNYAVKREAMLFQTLRDTQGLHAPLRLQMERKLTSRIQRLPPLESSMIAFDTLTGNDTCLPIETALGDPSGVPLTYNTHDAMEKKLKFR